jgi:Matrixin
MKTLAIVTTLVSLPIAIAPDANLPKSEIQRKEDGTIAKRKLPIRYTFGYNFPEDVKADVWLGFEYWNSVLGVTAFDLVAPDSVDADEPITVLEAMPTTDIQGDWAVTNVHDWQNSVVMFLKPTFDHKNMSAIVQSVARHEAGHVLLFKHSDFEQCLMFPEIHATANMKTPKNLCIGEVKQVMDVYGGK